MRDVLTATGDVESNPPVAWYREVPKDSRSGRRHGPAVPRPADSMCPVPSSSVREVEPAGLLRLRRVLLARRPQAGPVSWRGRRESFTTAAKPQARTPRTSKSVKPTGLGAEPIEISPDEDPRQALVDWMVEPDESVLRQGAGQSLLEALLRPRPRRSRGRHAGDQPARPTPSCSNALAKHFVDSKFDLKHLIRDDLQLQRLPASAPSRTSTTPTTSRTSRATIPSG